ncbi:MAG: hypothetical protein AAF799_29670 [Myxococcota bacterium]
MSEDESDLPELPETEIDARAAQWLDCVMGVAAELSLDLDVTWTEARDMFARSLFAHAEARYGTGPRVAAALGTSVRTVKSYRRRRREEDRPEYNARRRLLELLEEHGPQTEEQLRRRLPVSSDTDYVDNAIKSLTDEGLVVQEGSTIHLGKGVVPWYLRTEVHPSDRFERVFGYLARLLGSRLSRRPDDAQQPALIMSLAQNLPADLYEEFSRDFLERMAEFDQHWRARAKEHGEGTRVLTGGFMTLGKLGEEVDEDWLARKQQTHLRELPFEPAADVVQRPEEE